MRGETKPNEKFNKARLFVNAHDEIARTIPNWKKMGWRTLYAALQVRGAQWDTVTRNWYVVVDTSTAPKQQVKVAPRHTIQNRETVLVRIIASPDVINKAVADMLEIARASDMLLTRNSGVLPTHDGQKRRVYLNFLLERKSGK